MDRGKSQSTWIYVMRNSVAIVTRHDSMPERERERERELLGRLHYATSFIYTFLFFSFLTITFYNSVFSVLRIISCPSSFSISLSFLIIVCLQYLSFFLSFSLHKHDWCCHLKQKCCFGFLV